MNIPRLFPSIQRSLLHSIHRKNGKFSVVPSTPISTFWDNTNTSNMSNLLIADIPIAVRTLYSENFLGISDYERNRLSQAVRCIDRAKLQYEMSMGDTETLMRSTIQSIYAADKSTENLMLIRQCLLRIHKNPRLAKSFVFGPLVMRMLHFLNKPDIALQVLTLDQKYYLL